MRERLIFVSSRERINSLNNTFNIPEEMLREGDYLFKIDNFSGDERDELLDIINQCQPYLKRISNNKEVLILKVIPEHDLFKTINVLKADNKGIAIFLNKITAYFINQPKPCWNVNNKKLDFKKSPLVMGILNVTPDSFSDGGLFNDKNKAVEYALQMVNDGADIIDIGGESTRPGAEKISVSQELNRVIPVIESIRKHTDIFISVDTYKSRVAEEALHAGADIINDISGMRFDIKMMEVVSKFKCPYILMHIQGTPETMQQNPLYTDVQNDVYNYLSQKSEEIALCNDGMVIIDPGFGFGKRVEHNLQLLRDIIDFTFIGKPILIGISRKSFIGKMLDKDVNQRFVGTIVTEFYAALRKTNILRVHDVKETVQAKKMLIHILAA